MESLTQRLKSVDRTIVIDDTTRLIDEEVRAKSGITGMALKGGYKVVQKLKPTMIEEAVDHLLDDFTAALDPLYQQYLVDPQAANFERFLASHDEQAAHDLLSITDKKAERADNRVLKSTYKKLRGQAERHVRQALPGVGRLIDRHAPKK